MNEKNEATQKQQSDAAELKALTDKFLSEHGVAKEDQAEKKSNVKLSDLNILIAVPAYSGELKYKMVLSLLSLTRKLVTSGFGIELRSCRAAPSFKLSAIISPINALLIWIKIVCRTQVYCSLTQTQETTKTGFSN